MGNPCLDSWPSSESADASEKSEQSGRTAAVAAGLSMSVRITELGYMMGPRLRDYSSLAPPGHGANVHATL